MLPACPPMASTQPAITSSTAPGSTSARSSSPRHARAPKSTGCIPASAPLRLPTAVRTASMTYASGIFQTPSSVFLFRGNPAKDNGEILLTHLFCGEWSAGLIPAHRHPGGVTDETVNEVDLEVGPKAALLDALMQQLEPHLALLPIHVLDISEPGLRQQPLGFVLVDDD